MCFIRIVEVFSEDLAFSSVYRSCLTIESPMLKFYYYYALLSTIYYWFRRIPDSIGHVRLRFPTRQSRFPFCDDVNYSWRDRNLMRRGPFSENQLFPLSSQANTNTAVHSSRVRNFVFLFFFFFNRITVRVINLFRSTGWDQLISCSCD